MEDLGHNESFLSRKKRKNADGGEGKAMREKKGHKTVLDGVPRSRVWSILSILSGIFSIVISIVFLFIYIPALTFISMGLGAFAILFSLLSRRNLGYFDGMAVSGIIT